MRTITLAFQDGSDLKINEDELPTITDEELEEWGISREKLNACFVEGIEFMERNTKPDPVRPIAQRTGDGLDDWEVFIVGYSPLTDPLTEHNGAAHKLPRP